MNFFSNRNVRHLQSVWKWKSPNTSMWLVPKGIASTRFWQKLAFSSKCQAVILLARQSPLEVLKTSLDMVSSTYFSFHFLKCFYTNDDIFYLDGIIPMRVCDLMSLTFLTLYSLRIQSENYVQQTNWNVSHLQLWQKFTPKPTLLLAMTSIALTGFTSTSLVKKAPNCKPWWAILEPR